jgi:hypothetical protein
MAGHGPAPRPADQRAGHNKDPIPQTKLVFTPGVQPELPEITDHHGVPREWHPMTLDWWRVWGEAAQSDSFTATDWTVMLETAFLHDRFWNGDMKVAPELRLRVAKFGATPEDRARLRMVFADADEKDAKRGTSSGQPTPASPYGGLRAVPQP